ncbi:MAG: division/cell wall cluster transcriptional repressor MraZ [Firmicutes bacterium]|nr:division/cell wall cluster transcriptional repressor MraZ [Bacillota bacterium]
MLMGIYQNQIDAKNRVIVPAKFREELGMQCVLTRGLDECLILYPMATWQEQQKQLMQLPRSDAKVRAFLRYTYANARDVEIDKQGRILFPQDLRQFAHMEKELVTIGMIDRVEIWSKDVYDNSENGGKLTAEDLEKFSEEYRV